MKSRIVTTIILASALFCVGCAKQPSTDGQSDESSQSGITTQDEPSEITSPEEVEGRELDLFGVQYAQNDDALVDYLAANPIAAPFENKRCFTEDSRLVLMLDPTAPNHLLNDELHADRPIINHRVDDPIVGDQINFIFIRETGAEAPQQLDLEHMARNDAYIAYQLEPEKTYELLVYVQNNAVPSASGGSAGTANSISIVTDMPKMLTGAPDKDYIEVLLLPEFPEGNVDSLALPTCEQPVTLHWKDEARCYDADGKYVRTHSLDSMKNPNAQIVESDGAFSFRAIVAENYPAGAASFYRFEFRTDPSLAEPTMPNTDRIHR